LKDCFSQPKGRKNTVTLPQLQLLLKTKKETNNKFIPTERAIRNYKTCKPLQTARPVQRYKSTALIYLKYIYYKKSKMRTPKFSL
jgi:hypothetical protein